MDKRLIAYNDWQLPPDEETKLRAEIAQSPSLQKELLELNSALQSVCELNITPPLDNYFAEARVRMHARIRRRGNRSTFSQYALAGSGAFSLALMLFFGIATRIVRIDQAGMEQTLASSSAIETMALEKGESPTVEAIITEDEPTAAILDQKLADEVGIKPENTDKIISDLNISTDELVAALPSDAINSLDAQFRR